MANGKFKIGDRVVVSKKCFLSGSLEGIYGSILTDRSGEVIDDFGTRYEVLMTADGVSWYINEEELREYVEDGGESKGR